MKAFFARNIDNKGRLFRGLAALVLFAASAFGFAQPIWLGVSLLVAGGFVTFEALRGWCLLRACGVKTRLGAPFREGVHVRRPNLPPASSS